MKNCNHKTETWQEPYLDQNDEFVKGQFVTQHTTEDLDTGRFRCTQCGEVMYYTGLWKKFYEEGVPCAGSELVKRR